MKKLSTESAKLIVRPTRAVYDDKTIPISLEIPDYGKVKRVPIKFFGSQENLLTGSLYTAEDTNPNCPCVIYLHDSSSNQFEGQYLVSLFIPIGINVFCFDFAGSGNSNGEYISLGYYEHYDALQAITFCKDFGASCIALWGRSMGAATALMCLDSDICAVVADTPYSSLQGLYSSIAQLRKIPTKSLSKAISSIEQAVFSMAHFKMTDVIPINSCSNSKVPVFLLHSTDDAYIPVQHSIDIFHALPKDKRQLFFVSGPHEAPRPDDITLSATEFIAACCGIEISFEKKSSPNDSIIPYISDESDQKEQMDDVSSSSPPEKRRRKDSESTDDCDADYVISMPPSPIGKSDNQSLLAAPVVNSPVSNAIN